MYANGFRYYFTPLPGYFSPFPHGTCPLSVIWEYLGLPGGPGRFTRDFSGPVILGILFAPLQHFDYGAGTLCGWPFNAIRLYNVVTLVLRQKYGKVPQPRPCNACRLSHMIGLACSAFARHYLRNHCCFLFLWVLRCFTSPRSLYPPYIFRRESLGHLTGPVGFPHSEILGSKLAYQLPEAYRRLLRPSSAPDAKASTVCTYKFESHEFESIFRSEKLTNDLSERM